MKKDSILLVKVAAIGDVLMAISAARRLQLEEFTWLCGSAVEPLIRHFFPQCKTISFSEKNLFQGNLFQKVREIARIWFRLGGCSFGRAVILHRDRRYGLLVPPWAASEKILLDGKSRKTMLVPGRYHADEYFRILSGTEIESKEPTDFPEASFPLPSELEPLLQAGCFPKVVLAPGGARNILRDNPLRRWPIEHYVRLAGMIIEKGGSVILVGGKDDSYVSGAFEGLQVTNLIGMTSLLGLIGLFQRVDFVVTHDSGPLHMALASGTRVIALFGPTDPGSFTPRTQRFKVIWGGRGLGCRPCYDGRDFAPCDSNDCLKEVSPEEVVQHIHFGDHLNPG